MPRPQKQIDQAKLQRSIERGKTLREIASEQGVSPNTIRSRVRSQSGGLSFQDHRTVQRNIKGKK